MLPQAQRMGDTAQPDTCAPHKRAPAASSVVVGGLYKLPADEVVDPLRAEARHALRQRLPEPAKHGSRQQAWQQHQAELPIVLGLRGFLS